MNHINPLNIYSCILEKQAFASGKGPWGTGSRANYGRALLGWCNRGANLSSGRGWQERGGEMLYYVVFVNFTVLHPKYESY
jgi:hypothetical protein